MCDGKNDNDPMRRAYAVTGKMFRDRLRSERPDEADELASVQPAEVVAVRGSYDHIHRVLQATGVPFLDLPPAALARADWKRMQVLLVNCPGQLPPDAMRKIPAWVREGGYLVTTDWALKHVLEPLFPGRAWTSMRPPCRLNFTALDSRFTSTCWMRWTRLFLSPSEISTSRF